MKPAILVPTAPRGRPLMALIAVAAVIGGWCAVQSCGGNDFPATVSWTGSGYGVAWAKPELGAVAIYAHRFDQREFEKPLTIRQNRGRTLVHRVRRLLSPPEIVGTEAGSIVLVHSDDEGPSDPRLLAIPLGRDGRVSGPVQLAGLGVHAVCKSPTWNGRAFSYAYTSRYVDGSRTFWKLTLGELNLRGERLGSETFQINDGEQCSLARDEQGRIQFVSSAYGTEYGPIRLLRYSDRWARLRVNDLDDRTLSVDVLDSRGRVERSVAVPDYVSAATADLGVNDNGLYVTWIGKGKLHLLPLGTGRARISHPAGSDARGSRTVGHDDRCAVVWTVDGGTSVRLGVARDCR